MTDARDEEDMRNELQNVQIRSNLVTDESLESTRRMLKLAEESQDVGTKTLVMLDEQGEQLNRIDQNMDKINEDMREAEKNLQGMEKCCGLCVCPWKRVKKFEMSDIYNNAFSMRADAERPRPDRTITKEPMPQSDTPNGYITRITNDAREDEMDENLGEVSNILGNLKSMALDMGSELDTQNKQVDRITRKAEAVDVRVNTANQRAVKIVKNQ